MTTISKLIFVLSFSASTILAQTIYTPVADADVYSVGVVQQSGELVPSHTINAIIMFRAFAPAANYQYSLAVNPYALPFIGDTIDVYGFASPDGVIQGTDFLSGAYVGTLVFPPNTTYGQLVSCDVSSFVLNSSGPYWAFNLRTTGAFGLSSLEQNYGNPPELIALSVPESSSSEFLAAACLIYKIFSSKKRNHGAA